MEPVVIVGAFVKVVLSGIGGLLCFETWCRNFLTSRTAP